MFAGFGHEVRAARTARRAARARAAIEASVYLNILIPGRWMGALPVARANPAAV